MVSLSSVAKGKPLTENLPVKEDELDLHLFLHGIPHTEPSAISSAHSKMCKTPRIHGCVPCTKALTPFTCLDTFHKLCANVFKTVVHLC